MNTVDVLVKARAMVEKPENWCKGADRIGDACCPGGAICEIPTDWDTHERALGAFKAGAGLAENDAITKWNDSPERKHTEILAAFDHAIAAERQAHIERE